MKIAINPDRMPTESYSQKWWEFLKKRNVEVKWVDLTAHDGLEQIKDCDGVMWRPLHIPKERNKAYRILHTIEHYLGIPVFPDHNTYWHYDNKIAQHLIFKALNIPAPQTWIFWDRKTAVEWAKNTSYPKVFKLSTGASSANVIKVEGKEDALRLIERSFEEGIFPSTINSKKRFSTPKNFSELKRILYRIKRGMLFGLFNIYPPLPQPWWQPEMKYVYFQEFVPENAYDTRITIIGNRAFGFIRYNREGEFRASGSGRIDYDVSKVDLEMVKIAFRVSALLKCQCMAYDFLYLDNQPVISEISYTFLDSAVHKCPGYWQPDLKWKECHIWPEEAQVDDFIEYIKAQKKKKT
ncbi:MAG: hypothetical protein ABIG56_03930 [Candidatus Omnitrophota bacterium]